MRSLVRHSILVLAVLQLAGCRYWRAEFEGPRAALSDPEIGHVRLTQTNNERIEVRVAEVQGDSIYGTIGGAGPLSCTEAGPLCNARIPVSEVGFIEVREFSLMRTVAVVAVPIATFVLTLVVDAPCRPSPTGGC